MADITLSHLTPDSQVNNWAVNVDHTLAGKLLSKPDKGAVGTNGKKGAYLFSAHPDAATSLLGAFDGARFLSTMEAEKALSTKTPNFPHYKHCTRCGEEFPSYDSEEKCGRCGEINDPE